MKIVPEKSFQAIDEHIAATDNPRHRAMLENYREHMTAEIAGDLDRIMATMTPEPVYHTYGGANAPGSGPRGQGETRAFYSYIFDNGFNILQKDIDRLIVTDDCIFSEGWMYTVYPGKTLAERGLDVDPSRHYLHTNRVAAILPYEGEGTDVRMAGEDVYSLGGPTPESIAKLDDDEIPDALR